MSKIKRFCLISFSFLLFAFSLLLPFKDIKRDNLKSTSAADITVQLNAGIYQFKLNTTLVDFPDTGAMLTGLDFNFVHPSFNAWVNANVMYYNASGLSFRLVDSGAVLHSHNIITNNTLSNTTNLILNTFILNSSIQVNIDFYTFITTNCNYKTTDNKLSILTFKNLGFEMLTGSKFSVLNMSSTFTKLRYYFSRTNNSNYFSDYSFYINDSNFTNVNYDLSNNNFILTANFTTQVFICDIYSVALNRDYYFKTLANSLMPYLHSYSIIRMTFNIVGQNESFTAVKFEDNKISYIGSNNLVLASYSSSGVSSFEWLSNDYNALAIHLTNLVDDLHRDIQFLYNNFVLLTDYEVSVIENKNKALEMLREKYTFYSMFSSMFDSCLITFKSLFNYSFFGVNLFSFMCAILTLSLIFFIFRILKGGKE